MQFAAVPAGTAAPAALTLRGGDHDVEVPSNNNYVKFLGDAHQVTDHPVNANTKVTQWSSLAGVVVEYMYTTDSNVLDTGITAGVPGVAPLDAAFTYLTQDMNASQMTESEFRASADALIASLDLDSMPAALLLLPAGIHATEAPFGALGGGPTLWRRSGTFRNLAEEQPQRPGPVSYTHLTLPTIPLV